MTDTRTNDIKAAGMKSRVAMAWLRDHQLPAEPLCYSIAYEYLHTGDDELKKRVDELDLTKDDYRDKLDKVFKEHILAKRYKDLSMQTDHENEYVTELIRMLVGNYDQNKDISSEVDKMRDLVGPAEEIKQDEIEIAQDTESYLQIKDSTTKDELSGLLDKNGLFQTLQDAIKHKDNHPMTVVHMDIDKFGHFNDTNGKIMGDAVLKHLGKLASNFLKGSDIISRLESDKFIIVLPKTGIEEGIKIADELRKKVAGISLKKKTSMTAAKITVSMGVSELMPGISFADVLTKAKKALDRSIDLGRNCVNRE